MLTLALFVATAPITVITASSTNDAPAACLLDGKCTWKPASAAGGDAGVDEGIGLRFRESLTCQSVEITLKTPVATAPVDASFGAYGENLTTKDGGKTWRANCDGSRTLFLRVIPGAASAPEIAGIRFLNKDNAPIDVVMPRSVRATVTASSVLSPTTAYQPAFLFDSKPDLAWATDGKKTDGKGAKLTITFDEPQEIAGVLLWNGYQRSKPHYLSNSRPTKISLRSGEKSAQVSLDTAHMEWQERKIDALPASKTIDVVIDDIEAGAKYKDLVVSELRFLDKSGRVIAPVVPIEKTAPAAALTSVVDKSYAGAVAAVGETKTVCVDRRMRVRSGGSFVIYTGDENSPEGTGVVEGGWEPGKGAALRVFGKRYRTIVVDGEYGGFEDIVPEIFQSDLKLAPFASLGSGEQGKIVDVVYDLTSANDGAFKSERKAFARDGSVLASGATYAELKKALTKALADKGALAAQSSVYTDVLLPTDAAGACKR
jgi:hypothetical protein